MPDEQRKYSTREINEALERTPPTQEESDVAARYFAKKATADELQASMQSRLDRAVASIPEPSTPEERAVIAVLDLMDGIIERRTNKVYEWPDDEADLHRNGEHLSFTIRAEEVSKLRAQKIVRAVIQALEEDPR